MKDYYDLDYFVTYKWKDIDINILKLAIHTTILNNSRFKSRINIANNTWIQISVKDVIDNLLEYLLVK